jgi:hypothetical protein
MSSKMPGVLQTKVQPFWRHCSSSSAVSTAELYTKSCRYPSRKKSRGFRSLPSYPSPSVGCFKVISGSITEVGWGTITH